MSAPIQPFEPEEADIIVNIGERIKVGGDCRGEWHVFSDARDEWFTLEQENLALDLFETWAVEFGNARLYLEIYDKATDEMIDEECWQSVGDFPF